LKVDQSSGGDLKNQKFSYLLISTQSGLMDHFNQYGIFKAMYYEDPEHLI
jgi:hypothetical protein